MREAIEGLSNRWLSTFVTHWPLIQLLRLWGPPTIKLFLLLIRNRDFATVTNCKVNVWNAEGWVWIVGVDCRTAEKGCNQQVENRWSRSGWSESILVRNRLDCWLMSEGLTHCGRCRSWSQWSLGHVKTLVKQKPVSASGSRPASQVLSWFLPWRPALTSLNDGSRFESKSQINAFLPHFALVTALDTVECD